VSLKAVEAALAGDVAVWLLMGDDSFSVVAAAGRVVDKIRPTLVVEAFNLSRFRAAEVTAATVISALRTLPMMAPRRLVELRDLDAASDDLMGALEDYVRRPSEGAILVASGGAWPKVGKGGKNWAARLPKAIEAGGGRAFKFSKDDVDLIAFVIARAAELGAPMARDAAATLIEVVGNEPTSLLREVEKLSCFVEVGAPIDSAAVRFVSSALAEAVIWDVTTGIAARDPDLALGAVHRLLAEGGSPHHLIAMVVWQSRNLLRMAEMVRAGRSDDDIGRELKMRGQTFYRLRKALRPEALGAAAMFEGLVGAHRQMNGHKAGDKLILEDLILRLVSPA
jgi:DNA polymerase-3 subunit delta